MQSHGLTVLSLSLLTCLVFWRQAKSSSAADSDSTTWGATDPTWSPDGTRLGFSLFGSIWQVSSDGGEARQVSAGAGYHAHPAWSPKGDQIAFVGGSAPGGRIPNIAGRLMIVDVAGGAEREIHTPHPTAGRPAWSPDGTRIACALAAPGGGALLYEIRVADGVVTPLQARAQRGASGTWTDASWSVPRNELIFATQRSDAPQIWSMPGGRPPIMIQLPLTRYRREDICLMDSVSAIPDGSGVVYSAVVVNGKGDYELYRVPPKGGKPEAITNTTRDEFAPAVSPDSRRIAVVSNHLGNIDLFMMPIGGGDKTHVRLTSLQFRKSAGRLRVTVLDETGQPTPARLYVRASDGKAYSPQGVQIFYYSLDPGKQREGFFIGRGDDTFPVPAGKVELTAVKGIEYEIGEASADVAAGDTAEITLQLRRWTNWTQRGWWTGENHFHANYNGSYYQRPPESLAWLKAMDLNTANMIVANAAGAFIHDKEFFTGKVHPLSTSRYVLFWGQEYRNSDPLGHMGFLNIRKQVPPSYTSVIGSDSPYDFPLNTMAALEAKQQGGFVTYMHPISAPISDVFDTGLGAKESPVTAALGALNSIDVLPYGRAAYELWYRLLNCGFKIVPGAGTDAFTNWRGINRLPGSARAYVDVGPAMSWDRWVARHREGRNFVTTAPLVTFAVNGQSMGSEIRIPSGQPYRATLTTEISSPTPLRLVEFIRNGEVIESQTVGEQTKSVRMQKDVDVSQSCWFGVRVTGIGARGFESALAHSGAVWVTVDGLPTLLRADLELMIRWIDRFWALLEERNNFGPGDNRARAQKMVAQARQHMVDKLAKAY
jgi:TolB protein